jgi:uncharacterized protein
MQYIVLGYDGSDEGAMDRRLAARDAHLAQFRDKVERGVFLFGSAILNDEGRMIGSMIVCDFPSREELEREWLEVEPYVTGKVWQRIEISRAMVPPFLIERS